MYKLYFFHPIKKKQEVVHAISFKFNQAHIRLLLRQGYLYQGGLLD